MTTTTHQAVQPEFRLLVLLVSIGFFMQALDTTIVNTAIPAMAVQLNEDPLQMHGVIVAYVLSVAACIPLSGWLADRFGIRNIYLSSMVIFSLASVMHRQSLERHERIATDRDFGISHNLVMLS